MAERVSRTDELTYFNFLYYNGKEKQKTLYLLRAHYHCPQFSNI
jgi:hypothetical protein